MKQHEKAHYTSDNLEFTTDPSTVTLKMDVSMSNDEFFDLLIENHCVDPRSITDGDHLALWKVGAGLVSAMMTHRDLIMALGEAAFDNMVDMLGRKDKSKKSPKKRPKKVSKPSKGPKKNG